MTVLVVGASAAARQRLVTELRRREWPSSGPRCGPDALTDTPEVSPYVLHRSPTHSAIFGKGQPRRSNVAHFMAELITDDGSWRQWKGQMPVIYDADST